MPDLDGGWDGPPLYRGRIFAPQILGLNTGQVSCGHGRYRLTIELADKREKNNGRMNNKRRGC
jgi:hypothetical protein